MIPHGISTGPSYGLSRLTGTPGIILTGDILTQPFQDALLGVLV